MKYILVLSVFLICGIKANSQDINFYYTVTLSVKAPQIIKAKLDKKLKKELQKLSNIKFFNALGAEFKIKVVSKRIDKYVASVIVTKRPENTSIGMMGYIELEYQNLLIDRSIGGLVKKIAKEVRKNVFLTPSELMNKVKREIENHSFIDN